MDDLESGNKSFVMYMINYIFDLASTQLDNSNKPKIIQIGQLEAEKLVIKVLGPNQYIYTGKICFFHFSSDVATNSLRYVKFI